MKHPTREEWVPYLFGEAGPELKKDLAAHLSSCPGCAKELAGWRRSLRRLDAWKVPQMSDQPRFRSLSPLFNLAAAAVLVLGLGIGLGRWFLIGPDAGQLRAGLENSLKASLVPELRQQMRAELASQLQIRLAQLQQDSSNALATIKSEAIDASAAENAQGLQDLLAVIRSARAEDQQAVSDWVESIRKQHESEFIAIRKDLETVAAFADDEIRAARLKLIELSALDAGTVNPP